MPTKAQSRKVLDGRGEVLSYTRNPEQFYLRVYVPSKEGYSSLRINDASDIETACNKALDVYLSLSTGEKKQRGLVRTPRSGGMTKQAVGKAVRRVRVEDAVEDYLQTYYERLEKGLIKERTLLNVKVCLKGWLIPYCLIKNIIYTRDIKLGSLDDFITFRQASRQTLKVRMKTIKTFLKHLARHRLIDAYEATVISDMTPKVKIRDIDLSANPPIRDEEEWSVIVKALHQWVKKGETYNNNRMTYFRRKFWSLIMVLKQCGARPIELLNMTWADIEVEDIGRISASQKQLDEAELRAQGIDPIELPKADREALGRVPRHICHLRLIDTKTGTPREVTCNSAEVLARWRKFQLERLAYVNKKHPLWNLEITPDTKVFDSPVDGEWKQSRWNVFTTTWRDLLNSIKDELRGPLLSNHPYSIYSLRATRAQELLRLGVDVAIAAKSLGHSASTMVKVYARLPVREQAVKAAVAGIEFGRTKGDTRVVSLEEV